MRPASLDDAWSLDTQSTQELGTSIKKTQMRLNAPQKALFPLWQSDWSQFKHYKMTAGKTGKKEWNLAHQTLTQVQRGNEQRRSQPFSCSFNLAVHKKAHLLYKFNVKKIKTRKQAMQFTSFYITMDMEWQRHPNYYPTEGDSSGTWAHTQSLIHINNCCLFVNISLP